MSPRDRQTLDLFGPAAPSVDPRPKGKAEPRANPRLAPAMPSLFEEPDRVKAQHAHIEPVKAQPRPTNEGGRPVPLGIVMGFEVAEPRTTSAPRLRMTLGVAEERKVIDDGSYGEIWLNEAKRDSRLSRRLKPEKTKDSHDRISRLRAIVVDSEEFKTRNAAHRYLVEHNKPIGVGPALRGDYGIIQATMSSRPDLVAAYVVAVRRLDALIHSLGGRPGDIHSIMI